MGGGKPPLSRPLDNPPLRSFSLYLRWTSTFTPGTYPFSESL